MIDSLLIANRGEIACRIQRTCRRLGIRTIAIYSDADARARHVLEADDAVCIGRAEAVNSYLNADAVMDAALKTGASAIHPGYGFLSEKVVLPNLCEEKGIIWVGPRAEVIAQMGSKIESKRIAAAAGVRAVPGYHGDEQDSHYLLEMANEVGFPVLIKASAGGGGKGMRRVDHTDQFLDQLALAKQEASRAFGDDRVLIEKLIMRPRHLEVQLAGDHHGNLVHLYERECSIQRNYQKVIEEAPAAHLPDIVRQRLFEQAICLGQKIGYDSLGTVEFVLEEGGDVPYFLEMNTRLQVEHPVTELIVGLDLVELQLRIASGEPLPVVQKNIRPRGWAIEARVNCEDPARNYQPQIGEIEEYSEPQIHGVRVDSGISAGTTISPYYDSMVAKVIGFGPTRTLAARRLSLGLQQFKVLGVGTNQSFLIDILHRQAFHDAPLTTLFMKEQFSSGWEINSGLMRRAEATAAWHVLFPASAPVDGRDTLWQQPSAFRNMQGAGRSGRALVHVTTDRSEGSHLTFVPDGPTMKVTHGDEEAMALRFERHTPHTIRVVGEDDSETIFWVLQGRLGLILATEGIRWQATVKATIDVLAEGATTVQAGRGATVSAMPGMITAVSVSAGQVVSKGDFLIEMEAMKLIHAMTAEVSGIVKAVYCKRGETVSAGMTLVEIEADESPLQENKES